jgi:hypothetical protein
MRKLLLFVIAVVLVLASCKKETDEKRKTDPDVYVVGWDHGGKLWVNGGAINGGKTIDLDCDAYSVFVSDNDDVYVAGGGKLLINGGTANGGKTIELSSTGLHLPFSVHGYGNDIYVAGQSPSGATLWKYDVFTNTIKQIYTAETNESVATSVFVSNNNEVYFAYIDNKDTVFYSDSYKITGIEEAKLWKDGTVKLLEIKTDLRHLPITGFAIYCVHPYSVFVYGKDTYVAGCELINNIPRAQLWVKEKC